MIEVHSRIRYIRRFTGALLVLCSVGLLALSVYRAATFPFTHDESLSFATFTYDPRRATKADNHLLNTFLMKWCSILFGNSELSLRLPNILAHVIYLVCTVLLLKRFQYVVLQIAGFVFLNLNPFLLDYFFLARGYGLALAFLMLSLYLLARAYEEKQQQSFAKYLYLSVSAGSLAVLANFAFLNYYLLLLLASAWLLFSDASLRRFSRSHTLTAIALFSASSVFLAVILYKTFQLQWRGRLYFGGKVGFISDTVGSLVRLSLYSGFSSETTNTTIAAILIGLFVALLLLGLYLFFLRKAPSLFALFLLILASAAVLPILQHRLVHTLFPVERAALYYLPLYAVALLSAFHSLAQLSSRRLEKLVVLVLPTAIAAILSWHFYWNFSPYACSCWVPDRNIEKMLETIYRDRKLTFPGRAVNLSANWQMEPSINFYRIMRNYTWLAPLTRKPIGGADDDYVYAYEREVKELPRGHHIRLTSYPDHQTVLLRVNRAREP